MSVATTSHPAALAGAPRALFVVSMLVQFVAFALLVTGSVLLYGSGNVLSAGTICTGGALVYFGGWWIRERSWEGAPSGAESYRTPVWVIAVNESAGLMTLIALIVGMTVIGTVLGFAAVLFVVFAIAGSAIVMAVRSAPDLRTVRIVRAAALAAIAGGAVVVTVVAGGGLEAVSAMSVLAGVAVLVLSAGIGASCTFVWGGAQRHLKALTVHASV